MSEKRATAVDYAAAVDARKGVLLLNIPATNSDEKSPCRRFQPSGQGITAAGKNTIGNNANKAVIYARVSSDGQTTYNQLPALRAWALQRNFNVVAEYIETGSA